MSADDDSLFRSEMADVKPLQRESRVSRAPRNARQSADTLANRRQAAVQETGRDRNTLTDTGIAPLDPWY
ncbi:MAG: DNA endonuclease SmrA, partial [Halioglobus sp.]|nr:DNA endonuclease SmrA [Halioglobus sp.]